MAELKDSGARRNFGTGAVRDVVEGKGRCDLLPLKVLGDYFTCEGKPNELFHHIENYVRGGDTKELFRAMDEFNEWHWKNNRTMFLEVAKQYEDGAKKYNDRNWENGIPLHCYIDSGVRHYLKFLRGDMDEPHDRAFIWNMLGAIWTHENKPELIDLPFADHQCLHRTNDGYCKLHSDMNVKEPCVDGPCPDMAFKDKPEMGNPITGKYDGLSNEELQAVICTKVNCDDCPLYNNDYCDQYLKQLPTEARTKMLDFLNGLEVSE